jgi:hypothetical protein
MASAKQPDDAQHHVNSTISALEEIEAELEAEKSVAHAKGYISALRYSEQLNHQQFKSLDEALTRALADWHRRRDKQSMIQRSPRPKKPGDGDVNGYAIPRYIIHGGPELARRKGLPTSECQFFDEAPSSDEHRRKREAMWERWVQAGAEHIYP